MSDANQLTAPAGWAFLQQTGARDRSWWRLPVVLVGGLLGGLLFSAIAGAVVCAIAVLAVSAAQGSDPAELARLLMSPRIDRPLLEYIPGLAFTGASLIALAAVFIGIAVLLYRRPVLSYLTVHTRFRWRAVLGGMALTAPLMLIAVAVEWAFAPPDTAGPLLRADQGFGPKLGYALAAAVFLYLAALAEEVLFRGWLQQQVGAFTRRAGVVLLVSALLFSLAHWDPNVDAFAARAAMGLAFGWLTLRTGGIEFASGAHFANNLMIALVLSPITLTMPETREGFDWRGAVLQPALLLALIGIVEWVRRRPDLERLLGIEPPPPRPADWF